MEAIVKFSLLACLLATINAQPQEPVYTSAPPPAAYVHHSPYAPPHLHVAAAHPTYARILSQNYDLSPDGSYTFQYETEDGSARQESGTPRYGQQAGARYAPGAENYGGLAVQGRYQYASPEGPVAVEYQADEFGYQPSGPSIHPAIQKAVAEQVAFAKGEPAGDHYHLVPHNIPPPQAYRVPVPVYPSPLPPSQAPIVYKA